VSKREKAQKGSRAGSRFLILLLGRVTRYLVFILRIPGIHWYRILNEGGT